MCFNNFCVLSFLFVLKRLEISFIIRFIHFQLCFNKTWSGLVTLICTCLHRGTENKLFSCVLIIFVFWLFISIHIRKPFIKKYKLFCYKSTVVHDLNMSRSCVPIAHLTPTGLGVSVPTGELHGPGDNCRGIRFGGVFFLVLLGVESIWLKSDLYLRYGIDDLITLHYWSCSSELCMNFVFEYIASWFRPIK